MKINLAATFASVLAISTPAATFVIPAQASRSPQGGSQPSVSPDGRSVAFVSRRDGNAELYTVDVDGENLRRLTNTPTAEFEPTWSPDGKRLAFRRRFNPDSEAVVLLELSSLQERVVVTGNRAQTPAWSPDGKRLLFTSFTMLSQPINVINVDGSGLARVASGMQPAWSPDGKLIAYVSRPGPMSRTLRIYVANSDGTGERQVSQADGTHELPAWSRDGKRIAYQTSLGDHNADVRIVELDGSRDVVLPGRAPKTLDEMPAWLPDGSRLVIASDRDGVMRLYVVELSGKVLTTLTP